MNTDWEKISEILAKGGSLFLHPSDYEKLAIAALKNGKMLSPEVVKRSLYVEPGTAIACADFLNPIKYEAQS